MIAAGEGWQSLLAQAPTSEIFINPWKLLAIFVVFVGWALFAQWVDKDTIVVNTYRILWNLITLWLGLVTMLLTFVISHFAIGFIIFAVANLALMLVYVIHRNGLVPENDRVLTAAHFRRIQKEGFSGKKKKKREVKERVRLSNSQKKGVSIPDDEAQQQHYALLQEMLFDIFWRRAAVAELVPAAGAVKSVYQIDGVSTERESMTRQDADGIIAFLKGIAGLNLEERRKPQTGRIWAAIGENKYEVRVRTDGSTAGEKLTLRILSSETKMRIADLGFTPKQLEQMEQLKNAPKGLILLTGTPGSGLTTTIYSLARSHDAFLLNIQSVETSREVELDNITQNIFTPGGDKTLASETVRAVRSDPDILLVPDVRDAETALTLAKAAAARQKVYVTIQAVDVFDALKKWLGLVGDKQIAASGLTAIVNQRLVRTLCPSCKQPYKPDAAMMRKLNMPADKVLYRPPDPAYDKQGNPIICQSCQGTNYVGRAAVFDLFILDDAMRDVIRKAPTFAEIQNVATKRGGLGLQQNALHKVLEGATSIQEVIRATRAPDPAPPAKSGPSQAAGVKAPSA